MKILLITGRSRSYYAPGIEDFIERVKHIGWTHEAVDLEEFLRNPSIASRFDDVAVAGGDGTVNAVLPFVTNLPLLVVPAGTGNDFARSLGIRSTFESARHLQFGRRCRIDRGRIAWDGGRASFANGVGIGLDGLVASHHAAGIPYVLGTILGLVSRPVFRAEVSIDGGGVDEVAFVSLLVANGSYFGNGMRLAPRARIDDGHLDLVMIRPTGRFELLSSLGRARNGRHLDHPAVQSRLVRSLTVESERPMPFHIDGEPRLGVRLEIQIEAGAQLAYGDPTTALKNEED